MLYSIVGSNTIGKTLTLRNNFENDSRRKLFYSEHLTLQSFEINTELSDDELNYIGDVLIVEDINIYNKRINIKYLDGYNHNYSSKFLDLVRYIFLPIESIYIDEPEVGLSNGEIYLLSDLLISVGKTRDIYYTTHSWYLYNISSDNCTVLEGDTKYDIRKMLT